MTNISLSTKRDTDFHRSKLGQPQRPVQSSLIREMLGGGPGAVPENSRHCPCRTVGEQELEEKPHLFASSWRKDAKGEVG